MVCNIIKKRLQQSCFPVRFAKFLRTPILKKVCERLLLEIQSEIKLVWNFTLVANTTSVRSQFFGSVDVGWGFTSVWISPRSLSPTWNFKPQWVFHINKKCSHWNGVAVSALTLQKHVLKKEELPQCLCYINLLNASVKTCRHG